MSRLLSRVSCWAPLGFATICRVAYFCKRVEILRASGMAWFWEGLQLVEASKTVELFEKSRKMLEQVNPAQ